MSAQPNSAVGRLWFGSYDGTGLTEEILPIVAACVAKMQESRSAERGGGAGADNCVMTQSQADIVTECPLLVVTPEGELRPPRSGGYRSDLISSAGTPEAASAAKTLLDGTTPDLRHFCTAWYLTPQASASDCNPPAAEITRSTTFGSSGASHISRILQPMVANSKQPVRGSGSRTMQLMVVRTRAEAKREFSKNLNAALDRVGAPVRGRPAWLRAHLKTNISREACRKWLKGLDIPDQQNMTILSSALNLNIQQLTTGRWEPPPGTLQDADFAAIQNAWPTLSPSQRSAVRAVIEGMRAEPPASHTAATTARRRS